MYKLNWFLVETTLKDLKKNIFSLQDLVAVFKVTPRAAAGFVTYHARNHKLTILRRGLYTFNRSAKNLFQLANTLYTPSYISLDSALAYYNIIPETIFAVMSVTPRPTREFMAEGTGFTYQKIKSGAYTGYQPVEIEGQLVLMATPEKALADFGYFWQLGKRQLNDRLNLEKINRKRLKGYLMLFNRKNLLPRMAEIISGL